MFDWLKRKPQRNWNDVRELLFGDVPLETWAASSGSGEPWGSFAQAQQSLARGDRATAVQELQKIVSMPGLESRHYLEAWHALRANGIAPAADEAKHLLGVVVDVHLDSGLDTLAAYEDHAARYLNFSGAGVIWERPDDRLDAAIDRLLDGGRFILDNIGPWEGDRPPAPRKGNVRISLLTPRGLHFGEGGMDVFIRDPLAAPTFQAATLLMQALTSLPQQ